MKCFKRRTCLVAAASVIAFFLTFLAATAVADEYKHEMKPKDVKALVASAKTAEDHMRLARHFTAVADRHEAEAAEHELLAVEYLRNPRFTKLPMAPSTPEHCRYYAAHCREAAEEMRALAAYHIAIAKKL